MAEAKVPDDTRSWNALDIYIFCNGQQYTPPRKFHLQSDKLKQWESTLKFLARSQYGSAYSTVNLYSMEGKKVDGPLELTNDAAYVAVAPHDCFVQSGYDKYLLKASRSREKRHEKRINNINANQDDHAFGVVTIKMNNMQKNNTNILTDIDKNKEKNNIATKHVLPSRPTSNKAPLTKSPIERRKINSRNTILRKINNSGKVINPSQSLKGKEISAKILHPGMKESLDNMCKKSTPLTNKTIQSISSHLQTFQKQEKPPQEPEKIASRHKAESRSNTALDIIVEKDDGDNITQKTVYQNLESDAVSYFVDAESLNKNVTDKIQRTSIISTFNCSEIVNDDKHIVIVPPQSTQQKLDKTGNDKLSEEETKKCCVTMSDKQPNTENKDCVINVNLNIELKNCDAHSSKTKGTFSKSYFFNPEKQSQTNLQIDLDKDLFSKDDTCLNQLNAMKSLLDNDGTDGQRRIIIIRCSCAGDNYDCSFKNIKNSKHYICLPTQNILLTDSHQNEDLKTVVGDTITSSSQVHDTKEHKVSISTNSPKVCESSPPKMDTKFIEKTSISTQTDWCNTFVEARCNKDGYYSFYLPPLEKLNELKL